MHYDTIIVGGGSAGCVLAHRLSEDPAHKVLLLEAGQDYLPGLEPADILDSFPYAVYYSPHLQWRGLNVQAQEPVAGEAAPRRFYEQARVIGGGSSINGQFANRGAPADYDQWQQAGADGWGWNDVLPFFRKLERDLDFDGPSHGKEGRIPIRRIFPHLWSSFSQGAAAAIEADGFENIWDQNEGWRDGYFPASFSNAYDRRVSAAVGYLDSRTRTRPNLHIRCDAEVAQVLVENQRAVGVVLAPPGRPREELRATREVVLSAGALHTPALLLRSGIGPGADLQALGIPVLKDLPGVGQNLQDHPSIAVSGYLQEDARLDPRIRRHIHLSLRYTAAGEQPVPGDMFLCPVNRSSWHAVGHRMGSIITILNKPYSRGYLKLASPQAGVEPDVHFRLLSDPRDMDRLVEAVHKMTGLFRHPGLAAHVDSLFLTSYSQRVRNISKVTPRNRVLTNLLGKLLDGPPSLRAWLIRHVIAEGEPLEDLLADRALLERNIRRAAVGVWHPAGTCRMGRIDDTHAVTDNAGRVFGVAGLRVADASLIPVLPRGNTNLPAIMIGEKIAHHMLRGH